MIHRPPEAPGSSGNAAPLERGPIPFLLLLALVAAVYLRTAGNGFILLFDDDQYVTANDVVRQGLTAGGAAWAFTTFQLSNWHPLTWLSLMAEVSLFGTGNAAAHHLVSAALHGVNALLFFAFLRRTTGRGGPSLFAAALFAVHPIHVESVAWISERKDLLCTLFFLLALHGWARYVRRPSGGRYAAVAILFSLALLSKPMAVTFPFVLLLLDAWPLGRTPLGPPADGSARVPVPYGRLVLEKAPLLLLSIASSAVTMAAQAEEVLSAEYLPAGQKAVVAAVSYAEYLGKFLFPVSLAMYYPLPPPPGLPLWMGGAAVLLLAAITYGVLSAARRHPFLPTGWFWFLGTMVPVIGLVKVGTIAMADRYAYLPFLGLYFAVAFGLASIVERLARRPALPGAAAAAVVAVLVAVSFRQVGYWKDTEALFLHTLDVTPPNYSIRNQLGAWYQLNGREGEALVQYEASALAWPGYYPPHLNAGEILLREGKADRALPHLLAAVRISPRESRAALGVGEALEKLGRGVEAATWFERSLTLDPSSSEAREGLARVSDGRGAAAFALPSR